MMIERHLCGTAIPRLETISVFVKGCLTNIAMRMVRRGLCVAALIFPLAASDAATQTGSQSNDAESQELSESISNSWLNCPNVLLVENAGEDARGILIRIHCSAKAGGSTWDIRGIKAPRASAFRFEPW